MGLFSSQHALSACMCPGCEKVLKATEIGWCARCRRRATVAAGKLFEPSLWKRLRAWWYSKFDLP